MKLKVVYFGVKFFKNSSTASHELFGNTSYAEISTIICRKINLSFDFTFHALFDFL